jgi:hypothetical protein
MYSDVWWLVARTHKKRLVEAIVVLKSEVDGTPETLTV